MAEFRLETPRLIIRSWHEDDLDPFAEMSADPRVMANLGPLMDRDAAAATINRVDALEAEHGITFWALERREDCAFLGWCGVKPGPADTPIAGKCEIGWRLAHHGWGQGYARESAQAVLDWSLDQRGEERVWAITTPANVRSWGLMERLGMVRHADLDFDHPNVPDESPLKPHITYSIGRGDPRQAR